MKVEGAQPMEIEDDLAGSNLSSHLDWGVADQATSHSMSHHQVRESGPGKRSRDEDAMMADQSSSSAPSAEGKEYTASDHPFSQIVTRFSHIHVQFISQTSWIKLPAVQIESL
jgi:hypothetical protein